MSAATVIAPTEAPAIPYVPAGLLGWQVRAIARSGELATARGLHLIGRGVCRVAGHEGAPVYIVSSASGGHSHLVWIERGRIHCDCPARTKGHGFTCTHAQFVRLLLVAELATPASVPPAALAPETTAKPSIAPAVEEPAHRCPTCRGLADPEEVEQLGECLNCLQMRADYNRAENARVEEVAADQLPCWCCGAPATAETIHGLYCDPCAAKPRAQQRREAAARQKQLARQDMEEKAHRNILARAKERADRATELAATAESPAVAAALTLRAETARRVIAHEQERDRAGIPSDASPRAPRAPRAPRTEAGRRAAEKAARRNPAPTPDGYESRRASALQSIVSMRRDD